MLTHRQARTVLERAFRAVMGRAANLYELQFAQAVALYESGYGSYTFILRADEPPHEILSRIGETNNWGAVHCGRDAHPPCPSGCFEASDTDAQGKYYRTCFVRPASPQAGAEIFLREFYKRRSAVLRAANAGSIPAVAHAINSTRYSVASPAKLASALERRLREISAALGEPMPRPKAEVSLGA